MNYGTYNTNPLKIDDIYIKKHLALIESGKFNAGAFFADFQPVMNERIRKYKQYTTEHNSIDDRPKPLDSSDMIKAFNKIHNSFYNLIVDQKVGYEFGNPIIYKISDNVSDASKEWLQDFLKDQDIFIKNTKNGTQQAATGTSYALLDIESDGKNTSPILRVIDSWNGYVLDEKKAAVYIEDSYTATMGFVKNLYLITPKKITKYQSSINGIYVKPDFQIAQDGEKDNLLEVITLAAFDNNDNMQSDFETVEDLIDSYDRVISSSMDEVEQFRWAYMIIFGTTLNEDEAKKIFKRQTGIINMRDPNGSANFLTKDMPTEFFDSFIKLLSDNIYKFSKTIDTNDPSFAGAGGSESGEARKWKLIALEFKANTTEAYFKKGLKNLFAAITAYMNKKLQMDDIDKNDVTAQFTRTLPVDLGYLADVITKITSIVSDETALGMLSVIDDPEAEMEKRRKEQQEKAQISAGMFDPYNSTFGKMKDGEVDDDDGDLLEEPEKAVVKRNDEKGKSKLEEDSTSA
ncbi:phage portal protein [Listeria monocytogenes]|nr:phage portal protein [Listeria monocytogenes]EDN9536233.1 phage portal protein [Listeria monocytogenes]